MTYSIFCIRIFLCSMVKRYCFFDLRYFCVSCLTTQYYLFSACVLSRIQFLFNINSLVFSHVPKFYFYFDYYKQFWFFNCVHIIYQYILVNSIDIVHENFFLIILKKAYIETCQFQFCFTVELYELALLNALIAK